jgi:hypothetical protein
MKSPDELAEKLARQWHNAGLREKRLLEPETWPTELAIGKPTASQLKHNLEDVRQHLQQWRGITVGQVVWKEIKYRDTHKAINIPVYWRFIKPTEWIAATKNPSINKTFQKLSQVMQTVDPIFHPLLIRQLPLTADKSEAQIIQACELSLQLEQHSAKGLPLRALAIAGIDSKFFERHRRLIIKLLDVRFNGLVNELGLEPFLGALNENDHWLLVADLDGSLLAFKQIRVRSNELITTALPADNIIIVENEHCLHQLPKAHSTIAILGSGLNLSWMKASWLEKKRIAYWGDIDTWGLAMLAQARQFQSRLSALLMTKTVYQQLGSSKAVTEPVTAGDLPPKALTPEETQLYTHLLNNQKGRLEQEFLPSDRVSKAILDWVNSGIAD